MIDWRTCKACQRAIKRPVYAKDPRKCLFCGTPIPAVQGGLNEALEWISRGEEALRDGDAEAADAYFSAALVVDHAFTDAWIGKGEAAGQLSKQSNFRIDEMTVAFKHAVSTVSEYDRFPVAQNLASKVVEAIRNLAADSRQQLLDQISNPSTWERYIIKVSHLLDALHEVRLWTPSHSQALKVAISICSDILAGANGIDPKSGEIYAWDASAEYREVIEEIRKSAASALIFLDSSRPKALLN